MAKDKIEESKAANTSRRNNVLAEASKNQRNSSADSIANNKAKPKA